ncbi:MFS transporter [Microbaculum sp. FT89]|uniref:MFS transporter n=1 Tax=Microbaculum sp. FT89 TaxID=3447298 RepID=UPI003F537AE4
MAGPQTDTRANGDLPLPALAAVMAVIGAFALSVGYIYPAIALNLEERGVSTVTIGVLAAIQGLGVLVCSLMLPWLTGRFGAWRIAVWSLLGTAATMTLLGLTEDLVVWGILRFLLGIGANALFVICEVWINVLATERFRGRVIGTYTTVISGLFALGPLLVPVLGYQGAVSFGSVAVIYLLMGAPVLWLRTVVPAMEKVSFRELPRVMLAIPVLLLAVAVFSFFDAATFALWVVYAFGRGETQTVTIITLSVLVTGNVILQFPIGWLADRMNRRVLLALLSGAAFAGAIVLPLLPLSHVLTYVFLFFWGAAAFGVYTIAITLIGQYLTGIRLVAANAAFGVMWGIGALIGPWITSLAMQSQGPAGLPLTFAVVYGVLTIAALSLPPIRAALVGLEREGRG